MIWLLVFGLSIGLVLWLVFHASGPVVYGAHVLALSLASFALFGIDKWRARRGRRRIPEKSLWLVSILGGALGGAVGMQTFRHKTDRWAFTVGHAVLIFIHFVPAALLALAR